MRQLVLPLFLLFTITLQSQADPRLYDIIQAVSADRIESDIATLAGFGTRHTLSDTVSDTRVSVPLADGSKRNLRKYPQIAAVAWKSSTSGTWCPKGKTTGLSAMYG